MSKNTIDGFDVTGADLAQAVLSVERSAAKDDSRPVLAGILMEFSIDDASQGRIEFVAANGYRLSVAGIDYHGTNEHEGKKVLLTRAPLVAFARRFKKSPGITIQQVAEFAWEFTDLNTGEGATIPTFDAVFPDWRQIIGAGNVSGDDRELVAVYNPKYLADAGATAGPESRLRLERPRGGDAKSPLTLVVDGPDGAQQSLHVVMPIVRGVVE